jgi:hypothetical protein
VPSFVGLAAFSVLPGLVRPQSDDGALRQDDEALRFGRLSLAGLAGRAPHVDHSPVQVYVVPSGLRGSGAEPEVDHSK